MSLTESEKHVIELQSHCDACVTQYEPVRHPQGKKDKSRLILKMEESIMWVFFFGALWGETLVSRLQ